MSIIHYDLFAGIGGFSYALDQVFNEEEIKHIFCEWEAFPTAVLKKHWPEGTYYGDIADLVTDTNSEGREREREQNKGRHGLPGREVSDEKQEMVILTGGFPCQPFSHAGRRKGTADDRYKWPEMYEVIRNVRPDWVIAENVRGFATWNDGLVLERTCADLESEGYEVQPFIIPACAKEAPHQRERVWVVANTINNRSGRTVRKIVTETNRLPQKYRPENCTTWQPERTDSYWETDESATDTRRWGGKSRGEEIRSKREKRESENGQCFGGEWNRDWREVALATCHDGVDDGLPRRMDGVTISAAKHRRERLKACGNAIVPQVAMEIFKAIKK